MQTEQTVWQCKVSLSGVSERKPMVCERKGLRWYSIASAVFLLQTSEAFGIIDRLVYGEWEYKSGDKITVGLNLLMMATSFLLFWRAKRIGPGWILALATATLLLLSTTWSIDAETTFRRAILYLFIVIGTIGVAGSLDSDEAMKLVSITCGLCAVASIVLVVISPSGAFANSALRGIFSQKNGLGQVMAAGTLAQLHVIRISRRLSLFKILALILFITLAFYSQSSTALLMILAFCTVSGGVALYRKGGIARILSILSIVVLVPAAGIFLLSSDASLQMIGKDATLTGRTELWSFVLVEIQQRPILGWGYSSFWSAKNPAAIEISTAVGWTVPQAHNALLGMLLDVGIVGAAFFLFLWARNVVLAFRCMNTSAKELAVSSLLCCGGVFIGGITEPVLLESGIFLNVFFMMGLMCEGAIRAAARPRRVTIVQVVTPVPPAKAQKTNFLTR
jgi:exopolysaccharide production protein ExoQ